MGPPWYNYPVGCDDLLSRHPYRLMACLHGSRAERRLYKTRQGKFADIVSSRRGSSHSDEKEGS